MCFILAHVEYHRKFRSTLRPLTSKPKNWQLSLEWVWHLKLRPILLRSLAVVCAALSLLIVWSEMTYQNVNPVLSVIGLLVQVARDRMSYGAIEVKKNVRSFRCPDVIFVNGVRI